MIVFGTSFLQDPDFIDALYILAVGLSFVNSWISLAIFFAVAMIWFIPDRRFER